MDSAFRPCVLAVFTNAQGLVLVGERAQPRGSWQFPQGGIDPGETPEIAVRREMLEELGADDFEIVARTDDAVRYHFPAGMKAPLAKEFSGQDQVWFHLRFLHGTGPDLERASDKEFVQTEWVTVAEAMRRIVGFKKDAYVTGLAALGIG